MNVDYINAFWEFGSSAFIGLNVRRLYKDKKVAGVSLFPTAYFSCWCLWNLYYYPALDQWWSFGAGILIGLVNLTWLLMALYYGRQNTLSP